MRILSQSRSIELFVLFGVLNQVLVGCSAGSGSNQLKIGPVIPLTNGLVLSPITGTNVMPLTVSADNTMTGPDGVTKGQCLSLSATNSAVGNNSPCVSVTVCPPASLTSTSAHCQVISGLLLDTGSVGLRVFRSVLNPDLLSNLTPLTYSGQSVAECMTDPDGSADWGPVAHATIFLAGEPGVNTPIQLIDSVYGKSATQASSGPSICLQYDSQNAQNPYLDQSPVNIPAAGAAAAVQGLGYNGILGVGLSSADGGPYYGCTPLPNPNPSPFFASGCNNVDISTSLAQQVSNPVALMSPDPNSNGVQDSNGEILVLPSVGAAGAASAFGYLVLGIGTRANNTPLSGVTPFFADSTTFEVTATLNGVTNGAFIDSGTSYYQIPAGSSTLGLVADCSNYGSQYSGYFCPANNSYAPVGLTFPFFGNPTQVMNQVAISIGNPGATFNHPNSVYSNIAIPSSLAGFGSSTVDLGLPFYLGRRIYHGISGASSSSFGKGPYWAF